MRALRRASRESGFARQLPADVLTRHLHDHTTPKWGRPVRRVAARWTAHGAAGARRHRTPASQQTSASNGGVHGHRQFDCSTKRRGWRATAHRRRRGRGRTGNGPKRQFYVDRLAEIEALDRAPLGISYLLTAFDAEGISRHVLKGVRRVLESRRQAPAEAGADHLCGSAAGGRLAVGASGPAGLNRLRRKPGASIDSGLTARSGWSSAPVAR